MKLLNILNKVIEYSFYLLLFLVPLVLTGDTSELFEFNKLWVTFILTLVIGAAWIFKMIVKKEFKLQRTPLDIPIILFLASQILSTVISIDPHVSLWGYYSRFNGGLLSIISYIFLYYAFVSNYKEIEDSYKESENSIKPIQIILFIVGIIVFFSGNFLSSLFVKTTSTSLFPLQLLISLSSTIAAFAIFMKASPVGVIKKVFYSILTSAVLVVLWGLPSHFGFDPTCLLFRGTLDVGCWTADFQPKIRVFSTLGQPDWLAAYLVVILPITIGILLNFVHGKKLFQKAGLSKNYNLLFAISVFVFGAFTYLLLMWTISRSAILAIWISFILLLGYYLWFYVRPKFDKTKLSLDFKFAVAIVVAVAAITFINGQPFSQLDIFTWNGIHGHFFMPKATSDQAKAATAAVQAKATPPPTAGELGGTDSGIIRRYVWQGAVDIWKNYPVLGSGVETFAFSYYKFRPLGHNLTSEWNFLYNKAHNEYLNFLATTGTVGIVTYLLMIGYFIFLTLKHLMKSFKNPSRNDFLIFSLLVGYFGILITNFFGFSVVMINIFFYLIPGLIFFLAKMVDFDKNFSFSFAKNIKNDKQIYILGNPQKGMLAISAIIAIYLIIVLVRFWQADRYYYFGFNYDRAGDYQRAYTFLQQAVNMRPSEPVFRDELALNNAVVGSSLVYQNQQKPDQQSLTLAKQLINDAVANSNRLTAEHPNNVVFAKSRVRIFYTLSQVDQTYLPTTLDAIKKAQVLAPTDADISYNLGVLVGQTGDIKKGITILQDTTKLKPDYFNAYYAIGIFYHQLALDDKGKIVNKDYVQKAVDEMKDILKRFGPNAQAQTAIDTWSKEL